MPISDPTGSAAVELSRAEQWVVHHVLLESLGLADGERHRDGSQGDETEENLCVIRKVEEGCFEFTPDELALVKRACGNHARNTDAAADRNLARAVVKRIEETVEEPATPDE